MVVRKECLHVGQRVATGNARIVEDFKMMNATMLVDSCM